MPQYSQDTNAIKGRTGERAAVQLLESKGFSDVRKREKGDPIGFDFKAIKSGENVTVEVKSTGSPNGIPDAMGNEFDLKDPRNPRLRADYLLVVRLKEDANNRGSYLIQGAHLLPKNYVNQFRHTIKPIVVLSRELKNELRNAPEYWVDYKAVK